MPKPQPSPCTSTWTAIGRLPGYSHFISGLLIILFVVPFVRADSVVTFNEIQYHPANEEEAEWIELTNQMAVNVDVSEWKIRGGVDFDFPEGTVIEAGGFLVIASDPAAVAEAAGLENVLGPWSGRLSNAGEQLRLLNNSGRLMGEIRFEDRGDWPIGADGSGASLTKSDPDTASPIASNWVASREIGGTPGARNFFRATDPVVLTDVALLDWGANWRYNESDDLASGWADADHPVSGNWKAGPGPLGFDTSALPVPIATEVTRPANNDPKVVTRYFEREFELAPDQFEGLATFELMHLIDDGAVFYINGVEVYRYEMPAGEVGSETLATSGGDAEIVGPIGLPVAGAIAGSNRISVEVHQNTAGSSDIAFGLTLGAKVRPPVPAAESVRLIFSEMESLDTFKIELANIGSGSADLTGVSIGSPDLTFQVPPQMLQQGEFVVFDQAVLGILPEFEDLLLLLGENGTVLHDAQRAPNGLRGASSDYPGKWLLPSEATFGAQNSFSFQEDVVINEIMYHFREDPGTPPMEPELRETTVIPIDANWRYNETGTNLGENWAQSVHVVDAVNWKQGAALLGAETNPATLPEPLRTVFANPLTNSIITYYAETDFELTQDQLSSISGLQLMHIIDDGAIFYLNGTEVLRFNLDAGAVSASTPANASVGNAEFSDFMALPEEALVPGLNRLSVEIHQRSATSSDVIFGAELMISEMVGEGSLGTAIVERDEEWLELFNKGDDTVDVSGWTLEGGIRYDLPQGTSIAPGGYLVIARDSQSLRNKYPERSTTIIGDFNGRLNNTRDTIRLRDAIGNPADEVTYFEGGRWSKLADGNGSSLELRDSAADNSRPEAWAASDESTKMPWQTVRYRMDGNQRYGLTIFREFRIGMLRAGEVLLDDVSVVRDPDGVAEELIQNGSFDGVAGDDTWRILGNHRHSEVVPDPGNGGNQVLHLIATGSTDTRHNHLETTFVDNTALNASQTYEVSYRARWLAGANQLNTRGYYQRIARTTALDRSEQSGTPGARNSQAVENIGPTFASLRHDPVIPGENQPVTIHADVSDPDGLGDVVLRARVDGEDTAATYSFVIGADGHGQGSVPGQSEGTVVQFWIEADDALGATSTFPLNGPDARALFQVEDGRGNDLPAQELRVIMLDADSDFMHSRFNLMSNEQLGGTAIYNGAEVFYDAGVRLRGSGAGRARDGNDFRGFRVSFPADHLFRGVHGSVGLDRSGRAPASKRQDEIYVKHMFNRAGIPCMYDDLVYFIPPTRVHTGTSILQLASYGPVFTESQFENGGSGSVFNYDITYDPSSSTGGREGLKPPVPFQHIGTDLRDLGDGKEQYRAPFELRTGRRRDDFSGWINFCQMLSLPADELEQQIDEWMDVDEWMRYSALMTLCGIGDTYILGGLQHNIRFYVPKDGRGVVALPWDMDFVFSSSAGGSARPSASGNVRKVFNIPRNQRLYWGHIQDLINTTFNQDYMTPWMTHYGSVVGQNFSSQRSYIRSRGIAAGRQLPDEVPFEITTNGGNSFEVDGSTATLEGKGWINIREFRLAGSTDVLPVEWVDDESWRVGIPLRPGANEVTLESYDFRGALLDSHALAITNLSTDPTPVEFLRITEIHYNPAGSDDPEFIELRNIGTEPLDISGVVFTNGIGFTFPEGTVLGAGEYVVVVRDRTAFEQVYGQGLPVAGDFISGGLSNSGERIELRDNAGIVILEFRFDDSWLAATDGGGASLTTVDDAASPDTWETASQWRVSSVPNGTPGAADPGGAAVSYETWLTQHFSEAEIADPTITGTDIVLNSATPNLLKFAFGLDPKAPNPPGSLPRATVVGDKLRLSYLRNRSASVRFSVEKSSDLIAWNTVDPTPVSVEPFGVGVDVITVEIVADAPVFLRLRLTVVSLQ